MKLFNIYIYLIIASFSFAGCKQQKESAKANTDSSINTKPVTKTPNSSTVKVDVVEGLNLGNKAPEIEMADPNGHIIKLSSLRGSLVLIDFWASWCGPCRAENPIVVATYNQNHTKDFVSGKGFEILSVSLDSDKGKWINAIEKDGLTWNTHVSDLKFWDNAAAVKYQISGIPTNFLVDANGIIIAKNLRGDKLAEKIQSLKK